MKVIEFFMVSECEHEADVMNGVEVNYVEIGYLLMSLEDETSPERHQ